MPKSTPDETQWAAQFFARAARQPAIFKGCIVVIDGDMGPNRMAKALSMTITLLGGRYRGLIDSRITHLICSRQCWKDNSIIVNAALQHPGIQIVTIDWLDACIEEGKAVPEQPYLHRAVDEEEADEKHRRNFILQQFFKPIQLYKLFFLDIKLSKKHLGSDQYNLHRDAAGFRYNIVLTRIDFSSKEIECFKICLFQSHYGPPFQFACTGSYIRRKRNPKRLDKPSLASRPAVNASKEVNYCLAPIGSQFRDAFFAWRLMFRRLTGVDWEFRAWVTPNAERPSGTPRTRFEGTSLHPSDPLAWRLEWRRVVSRAGPLVRDKVIAAAKGLFEQPGYSISSAGAQEYLEQSRLKLEGKKKRLELKKQARDARKRARREQRELQDLNMRRDIRTGLPRKRNWNSMLDDSSSDNESSSDENEGQAATTATAAARLGMKEAQSRYFAYLLPPRSDRGMLTMPWIAQAWFGSEEACDRACRARASTGPAKTGRFNVQSMGPTLYAGGGKVASWDWDEMREWGIVF